MFGKRNEESWAINLDNICKILRKIVDKTITALQIITPICNMIRPEMIDTNDFFRDD
jgi:hypothetical protein